MLSQLFVAFYWYSFEYSHPVWRIQLNWINIFAVYQAVSISFFYPFMHYIMKSAISEPSCLYHHFQHLFPQRNVFYWAVFVSTPPVFYQGWYFCISVHVFWIEATTSRLSLPQGYCVIPSYKNIACSKNFCIQTSLYQQKCSWLCVVLWSKRRWWLHKAHYCISLLIVVDY